MKNFNERIPVILQSDFYKQAHAEQYPDGTSKLVSYATARMSRMEQKKLIVFGIQAFVKRWLIKEFNETFFERPFNEVEDYYKWVIGNTFPLQYVDIEKFKALHELGYLPIEVSCLAEGTEVPIRSAFELPEGQCQIPFMKIENTHPDFAWLTEFLESLTSAEIWYPMCVANQAKVYRDIVNDWYNYTGCNMDTCKSAIAEFGFRGGKGQEAAVLASSAFLTSFNKTATIPAIIYNAEYYNEDIDNGNVGSGMISTEHSVMCSNYAMDMSKYPILESPYERFNVGDMVRLDIRHESNIYEVVCKCGVDDAFDTDNLDTTLEYIASGDSKTNILVKEVGTVEDVFLKKLFTEIYPAGALSVVMDSYDYWANIQRCGHGALKDAVMARNGAVFFRGDSGDPVDIICGEVPTQYKSLAYVKASREPIPVGKPFYVLDELRYYKLTVDAEGNKEYVTVDEKPVEVKGTVELLWDMFGGTVNEAGFKVLDSHVRAIYGDSITPRRAHEIYHRLAEKGFAACNVALGAGSFSMNCSEDSNESGKLYPFTRDSYGIAVKACYAENKNGKQYQIFKNPKTDTGKFKKSQRGMIFVTTDDKGELVAYDGYTSDTLPKEGNLMVPIFRDGEMLAETSLTEVRNRIHKGKF